MCNYLPGGYIVFLFIFYLFLFIAYNFFVCSVTHELIKGCVNDLMNNLIAAMDHPGSAENEYIMKGKVDKPSPSQNGG